MGQVVRNKKYVFVLLLLLLLPSVFSLLKKGFFPIYDDMQVIRLYQMDKCITDGQIPCRWTPDLGYGYGYPLFQYYAPFPYYLMEIFHLLGFSLITSVKIGFALSLIASGLFFFLFLHLFFSPVSSLVGAVLYVYAPARAADLYVRGAMGELWGMAILPFLLYSFESLLRKNNFKNFCLLSFATFLFLISHNLTLLMSFPLLITWIILRFWQVKKRRVVERSLLAFAGGLLLAAFFVLPLLMELNLVHYQTLVQGYFNYLAHFLSFKQIFFSLRWGYGPSVLGPNDDVFLGLGPIHFLVSVLALLFLLLERRKKEFCFTGLALLSFALLLFYSFLAHQRSAFIWRKIELLSYLQFPWRFIYMSIFSSSFLGAVLVEILKSRKENILIPVTLITITLIMYSRFFVPKEWINISDKEKLSGENWQRQVTASIYDFLPKSAKEAPKQPAPNSLIGKNLKTISVEKGSDWQRHKFIVESRQEEVSVPIYDFPGWKVFLDGKEIKSYPTGKLGLISFQAEKGEHEIIVKLFKSKPRVMGDLISLLTIFVYLFLIGFNIKVKRGK